MKIISALRAYCHTFPSMQCCAFLFIVCPFQVTACPYPSKADTLKTHRISEARVKAKRTTEPEAVLPSQRIEGEELERMGAHSVADALRYFSGIQIKDFGGIGGLKTVNIRSMGTNHAGIFYDGIELGNAQNGQIDLGRFSLDNMEAISLYNGQKSEIFQAAKDFGSAGTVYLQTRTPVFAQGEHTNIKATAKTGSFGLINTALLWEERMGRGASSSLSAEYMYTSGRYDFTYRTTGGYDTTATRSNGDVTSLRIEEGIQGRIDNGEWRAKAYLYHSERGLPGAMVRNKLFHEDRQWDTNLFLQGSVEKSLPSGYRFKINGKYAYDYLHYLADPRRDITLMYVDNRYRQQEIYLSTAHSIRIAPYWDASLSVDAQINKLSADLYRFPYPTRYTIMVAAATSLHWQRLKVQASLLATLVADKVESDTVRAANRLLPTPAIAASWQPIESLDLTLRGFYKRIFRMPTLNDLYYTFIGNIFLRPEYTNQLDLGFTLRTQQGRAFSAELQADAYYIEVTDKIISVPTSNQFRWTMMNLGFVKIRGADLSLQGVLTLPSTRATLRIAYTYQDARDYTSKSDSYYRDQIPYIPQHSLSAVAGLVWKGWDASYSFIYTGERYDQQANIAENFTPAWYTSDCSISRTLEAGKAQLKFTVEVNNIFSQQYEVVKSYPMPGTSFRIISQIQF